MRFEYFPDTDTLYLELKSGPGVDARKVAPNIVLDFNEAGDVIGIEVEKASEFTDLETLQLTAIPIEQVNSKAA